MLNYSFWSDEAYVSGLAAQLISGKLSLLQAFDGLAYQKLYILIIAFFFKLFGTSEFVARLPSLIFFLFGIIFIFFLAKKLGNVYAATISSFLYAFSHLNLAYATQAKPYVAIESITLLLMLMIVCVQTEKNKKRVIFLHVGILGLLGIATFLHTIGVELWILYFVYIAAMLKPSRALNSKARLIIALLAFILSLVIILPFMVAFKDVAPLSYNHTYQVIRLFGYEYTFLSFFAAIGFIQTFRRNKPLSSAVLLYSVMVLILATFQHAIFNIRYVLFLFGIMFLYFGLFWGAFAAKYVRHGSWRLPLIVIAILYLTGYKVVQYPKPYYNPNIDKYGDVQIANYKDFYSRLKSQYPDYKNLILFNDVHDTEHWYLGRYSNAYFMKSIKKPQTHPFTKVMTYGSLEDFKKQMNKYPKGLVIVEDWESLLPEDIKQYVKKNLKLEYRVESLKEAPDDPWPLALYSWGM